jgi:phosphohistidine swiveling domain-containing protein
MFRKRIVYVQSLVFAFCLSSLSIPSLMGMESDHKKIVGGSFGVGGNVTGRAIVVTGHKQLSKISQGDIVVASTTHSSWNDALKLSGGIITEKGGSGSHAALLGKKLGIPVIVGATGATKKIVDGSLIALDCIQSMVYEVVKNNYCIIAPRNNYNFVNFVKTEYGLAEDCFGQYIDMNNYSSFTQEESKIIKITHDDHRDFPHHIDFTLEQLQRDASCIKKHIFEKVAGDIQKAKIAGKWLAWQWEGISYYAFDSIPFEFFNDHRGREQAFARLEDGIEYLLGLKEAFKNSMLGNTTEIDESSLVEFLYKYGVDKLDVADEHRVVLKKDPAKMDEFVKNGIVKKEEYMDVTLRNCVFKLYLKQELNKK